jgi:hypothetical protein
MSSSAKADDPVNTSFTANNSRRGVLDTPHARGMTAVRYCFKLCLSLPLAGRRFMPSPKLDQQ